MRKNTEQEIEEGLDEIIARHKAHIARYGFTIQAVLGDGDRPPYAYTVGLSVTYNHPEVFIVGIHPKYVAELIGPVIEQISQGVRFDKPLFAPGIIPGYEIPFRPMSEEGVLDHGLAGLELIGPFEAVQMFYPDRDGYVPWEEECDQSYRLQLFFDIEGEVP